MKNYLITSLLLFSLSLIAQQKGASPVQSADGSPQLGTTYAVVIGISDYQNPDIPDLRFADKDAEAFAQYLRSPAGGSLPDENIKLLTNKDATMAAVASELDWLVEVSKAGDQAIIYFSGHGDVEAKTARQPGFLLTYDSPPKIYIAGAYPLFYLQLIVETLSSDKNVQTFIITDACRAGKLAGSEIGGTQATAANLAKQYANEIKILSCQPDEFSLEGEQWGGGRGAFSYHLIEGLIGLADKNENGSVNLLELENYLETVVPAETDPQTQIPMTVGSKGTKVADVDASVLAKLKDLKSKQLPTLAAIESRGFEETLLGNVDSSIQKKYDAFIAALDNKNLLDAQYGQPSADDLYRELIEEESLASLHRFMTRQFATALQDDAQQAINAYLLANPTELEKRWKGDTTYAQYPRYLGRAAELLGESHYMHDYLIAKQLYFEGLNLRLQIDQGNGGNYQEAIKKQEAALALEERAAFFYNELGVLHTRLKLGEKAIEYYEKAIELAPEWGLPYVNLCLEQFYNNENEKAMETGEKALALMPDYVQLYSLLGWVNANYYGKFRDKRNLERIGVELSQDFIYNFDNSSSFFQKTKKFQKTIDLMEKALEIDRNYAAAHFNLGFIYLQVNNLDKAVSHLKKAVHLAPENDLAFTSLGHALIGQSKYEEGEEAFKMAIQLAMIHTPDNVHLYYNSLGICYKSWGKYDKALDSYKKAIELNSYYGFPYANAALIYASRKDFPQAEWYQLKSLEVNSWLPKAYYSAGSFYHLINRYEDAEKMYLKAIALLPDYVNAINSLTNLYREKGNMEKALVWQQKFLETAPDDPLVLINTGELAYKNKQFEKAKMYFQKAEQDTTDKFLTQRIAWSYHFLGDKDLAEKYLRKALEKHPEFYGPYWDLGWLYFSFGEYDKAVMVMDEGIEQYPNAFDLKGIRGMIIALSDPSAGASKAFAALEVLRPGITKIGTYLDLVRNGNYEAAAGSRKEINAAFSDWWVRRMLQLADVRMLTAKGDFNGAMDIIRQDDSWIFSYQLLQRDPGMEALRKTTAYQSYMRRKYPEKYDDLDTFKFPEKEPLYFPVNCTLLAKYYESEGELERANFLYQKAVSLQPDTLTNKVALSLAEAYLKLGRFEAAKAICPDSISTNFRLEYLDAAKVLYRVQKTEQAEALIQKAIAMDSLRAYETMNLMGQLFTDHSDFERAEHYLYRSITKKEDYILPYANLASLYRSFNQPEKMMAVLEQGLVSNPNDKTLRDLEITCSYLAYPPPVAKLKFEAAAKSEPAFQMLWEYLKQIRRKEFAKATMTWKVFEGKLDTSYIVHTYLGALVQSGEMEAAIALLGRTTTTSLPYQLLTTYPLLEPLRKEHAYKDYLLRYFPEKTND